MIFTNHLARMAAVIILLITTAPGLKQSAPGHGRSGFDHSVARAIEAYGQSPLRFEANEGQFDARARFILRNSGYTLFLTSDEAAINLRAAEGEKQSTTVRMKFVNANPAPRVIGMERMASVSNYFTGGDPKRWRAGVANFGKVKSQGVWPGIDLVWYGVQRRLEHDFIVAPGADPREIRLEFSGAREMSVDGEGALKLRTGAGDLRLLRPVAWQAAGLGRQEVACDYRINGARQVEFQLGDYDRNKELVIDPVITLATWFGGADVDEARNLAVDRDGAAYIAGTTLSIDFPVANPVQQTRAASADAFALKLSPDGGQVVYATYLGGGGADQALSIAVDTSGAAYIAGVTTSTDFPVTPGASQTSFNGVADGFVTKLNANGSALVWSSLLGGDGVDIANDLAVDAAGNVHLAGRTTSTDLPANGFQTSRGGSPVYRSSDSGGAWNPSGAGLAGTTTYGLTVDPANPNVIYAATDLGLYKSVDSGARWRATAFTGAALDVAVDPRNTATIYVAAQGSLAKSVNGGESFTQKASLQNLFGSNFVYTVLVDPQTPATVYAGTERAAFKSVDGGETWTPSFLFGSPSVVVRVTRLVADPNNPPAIFAGTDRGVFKSANAGGSWSPVLAGAALGGFSASSLFPGVRALAIDPAQTATIYAGLNNTGSVYKSTNGGMTWSRSDAGIGAVDQVTLINALAIGDSLTLYAASPAGIYKSADGGASWSLASDGLNNPLVLSLAVDRNNPANVYAGTISGADAFAAKLNAAGSALNWLTYLGGSLNEDGAAIAIDRDGNSYITGSTSSSNFPVAGQIQNFGGGATDAFVTKLNPTGAAMIWSTYLGNAESENGYDIAVNASGEAYVVGSSAPPGGQREAYISKIRADGSSLVWSGSFGGNGSDDALSVALDPVGNPFVTGVTASVDFFPLVNASQTKLNGFGGSGATDAFVIGFDAAGGEAIWSTLLGGNRNDRGGGIVIDPHGNVYVAGGMASTDYPAVNASPPPVRNADAFIVKFTPGADLSVAVADLPDPVMINQNLAYTMTVTNNGTDTALGVTLTDTLPSGVTLVSVTPSQGTCGGGGPVACNLDALPINASATVTIVVTPIAPGTITNRAVVASITKDPNMANNSAAQETVVGNGSSIFGRVTTGGGAAVSGATVTLGGAANATTTTRGDGGFQFTNLAVGGAYTITPSLQGYVFTPASQSVGNLTSDRQVNFTAVACVFSVSPFKQSLPATGGTGGAMVTCLDQRCPWTARSNVPWITPNGVLGGVGNGTASFSVAPTVGSRSGTLTIAGNTFTVLQEFNPCASAGFKTVSPMPLPQGEASARFISRDFNSDGRPDLAFLIANPDQVPRVTMSVADNDGGFGAPVNVFTGASNDAVRSIHSGDFNSDGRADLVLTGSNPNGSNGRIMILLNNGSGGFSPPTAFSVGPSPSWTAIGDFNNDGKLDLAASTGDPNGNPGPIPQNYNFAMLPGDGAGRFGAAINSTAPFQTQGLRQIEAGDFNNDGKLDLAAFGFLGVLITLKGDGGGKFTPLSGYNFFTGSINAMALGDFNNDRRTDVMMSNGSALFADANGALGAPRVIAGASGASVVAEDFNGDGKTDAAFANAGLTTLLFSRGGGDFDPPVSYLNGMAGVSGFTPFAVATAGDYNRDGRPDLIVIGNPPNASQNMISLAVMTTNVNGELDAPRNFTYSARFPGEDTTSFTPFDAKTADFNGDGVADLAVAYSQDKVSILFGNGRGGFGAPVGYRTADSSNILTVSDFTRDGKPDLAALSPYLGRVTVLINDGAGRFPQTKSFATGGSPLAMAVEDFNGDGNLDIVAKGVSSGLSLFAGDGTGNFAERASGLASEFPSARFAAGDFDGDGAADLVVSSADDQQCSARLKKLLVLFGDGKGGFARTRTINTAILPGAMFAGDLNSDGRSDLVFASACSSGMGLYVMLAGGGGLGAPSLQNPNAAPVALGDFNGDGRLDVAARQGMNLAILTGKGDGALDQASIATLSTFFAAFAFGDFNEDGAADAAAVGGQVAIIPGLRGCAPASSMTTVSAASFTGFRLAAESIAAGFGAGLASETAAATTIPLPTTLAGVSVKVKDDAGVERNAPLFFVSPGQINYQVPPSTAPGNALLSVIRNGNVASAGTIQVAPVNPGIFAANASGQGLAAAVALRVKSDGSQAFEPVVRFDAQQNKFLAIPIDISNPAEQVFLILNGTGIRGRSSLSNVAAQVGGVDAEVLFAGPQGDFVGLDQVNLRLPRGLAGRGEADVVLTVDGKMANIARISIR